MRPDSYTIKWHLYQDYLQEILSEMMTSGDFTDVTLVTDDKKTIKAHRNILSACSPVFKKILQMDITNSHPVIYLRGIQYQEIEPILQFIYLGEATLNEERMKEFLLVSQNLEIRELIKNVVEAKHSPSNQNQDYIKQADHIFQHNNVGEKGGEEAIENYEGANEMEVISREITKVGSKFQCPQCDKLLSQNKGVLAHIRSVHEGVKYACKQCDQQFTDQSSRRQHIQRWTKEMKA